MMTKNFVQKLSKFSQMRKNGFKKDAPALHNKKLTKHLLKWLVQFQLFEKLTLAN